MSGDPSLWKAWHARNLVPFNGWPTPFNSADHDCILQRPLRDCPCTVTRLLRAAQTDEIARAAAAYRNYEMIDSAHQASLTLRRAEALAEIGFGADLEDRRALIAVNHDRIVLGAWRAYEIQLQQSHELMHHQRRTASGLAFRTRIRKWPRRAHR